MVHMIVSVAVAVVLVTHSNYFPSASAFTTPQHHGCIYRHFRRIQSSDLTLTLQLQNSDHDHDINASNAIGIRLNKVFKATHSRREADKVIESGRVCVNGAPILNKGGIKVIPYQDEITLDGKIIHGWEKMNSIDKRNDDAGIITDAHHDHGELQPKSTSSSTDNDNLNTDAFEYVKYFKPLGVICTTDTRIEGNIIDEIQHDGYNPPHRVYPVGRLDKETTGLIVLTSDGRMVNTVLRGEHKQPKVYKVMVNGRLTDGDLQLLRDGIVIKTVAQRKGRSEEENTLIAKTKRCKVERIGPSSCQMTLVEGRNRQIRKMMEAVGFRVVKLHRVQFMGLTNDGLQRPGDWAYLNEEEMELVKDALRLA